MGIIIEEQKNEGKWQAIYIYDNQTKNHACVSLSFSLIGYWNSEIVVTKSASFFKLFFALLVYS